MYFRWGYLLRREIRSIALFMGGSMDIVLFPGIDWIYDIESPSQFIIPVRRGVVYRFRTVDFASAGGW